MFIMVMPLCLVRGGYKSLGFDGCFVGHGFLVLVWIRRGGWEQNEGWSHSFLWL